MHRTAALSDDLGIAVFSSIYMMLHHATDWDIKKKKKKGKRLLYTKMQILSRPYTEIYKTICKMDFNSRAPSAILVVQHHSLRCLPSQWCIINTNGKLGSVFFGGLNF